MYAKLNNTRNEVSLSKVDMSYIYIYRSLSATNEIEEKKN